jgi:hypothetical protein
MGGTQSHVASLEDVKTEIYRRCDNYVAFAELSNALVDVEIEDLREELSGVVSAFVSELISLPHKESHALIETVERYANGHKHAVKKMFEAMMEAQQEFEMLATNITGDFEQWLEDLEGDSDSDDEDDDDYVTVDADADEKALAIQDAEDDAENDDDDESESDDEEVEVDNEYAHYLSDVEEDSDADSDIDDDSYIVSDEAVLDEIRSSIDPILVDYHNELVETELEDHLIERRVDELRRMLVKLGDSIVSQAVAEACEERKLTAMGEIENVMRMGVSTGMFQDAKSAREVLETCVEIACLCKERLRDLPFTQRAPVQDSIDAVDDYLEASISEVQLLFGRTDYQSAAEHLMDIGVDDEIELNEDEIAAIDRRLAEIEDGAMEAEDSDEAELLLEAAVNDVDDDESEEEEEEEIEAKSNKKGKGNKTPAKTSGKKAGKRAETTVSKRRRSGKVTEKDEDEDENSSPSPKKTRRGTIRGKR